MSATMFHPALCLAAVLAVAVGAPSVPQPVPQPVPLPLPWNNSGHRIVSFLAWEQLSGRTRAELGKLLSQHPRYQEDLQIGVPAGGDRMAAARHAFAVASTWPDTVRSLSHPMHRVANQPRWHYIDIPLVVGGSAAPAATRPPVAGDGPADITAAITQNLADLANRDLPPADRAIALCWVVHLIADLHQPLHACTLYSPQFPTGDKGGNAFFVTRNVYDPDSRCNLHALWDALLGNYESPAYDACVAAGLSQRRELSPEHLATFRAVRDPAIWAKESHDLAVEHAYEHGTLLGAAASDLEAKAPPLPGGYLAAAERVAMQRAAIAACRLADALERIFAPK